MKKNETMRKIDELKELKFECITYAEAKKRFEEKKDDYNFNKVNNNVKGISIVDIDNKPQVIKTLAQVKSEKRNADKENDDCFNIFSNVDGKIDLDRIKGRK